MKRFIYLFIFILLFIPSNCFASDKVYVRDKNNLLVPKDVIVDDSNMDAILKTPSVDSSEKIYDFANVLSDLEEKEIYSNLKKYIKDSGFDSVIVTTNDLSGFSIADYTYNFYDFNFFDDAGVIFVIYVNGSDTEIFMGNSGNNTSEIFSIYDDKRINEILKYVYTNYISAGKYNDACSNYVKIITGFYEKAHGDYRVDDQGNLVKKIPWIEIIIISLAVTFIIVVVLIMKFGNKKKMGSDYIKKSVNNETIIVKCCGNQVINK